MAKWVLLIAWAANGEGYTSAEFDTEKACSVAANWSLQNHGRGGGNAAVCINKLDGTTITFNPPSFFN